MFKKLKGLFIIEEEGSKAQTAQNKAKASVDAPATGVSSDDTTVDVPVSTSQKGEVTDKFLRVLLGAMDASNLDGFDYLEFKQFLKSLGEVQMDERTKYHSAFATAQTMGATLPILISSAEHYLKLLTGEREKFGEAVKNQKARMLDERQLGIQKLEQGIADKEKQIDKLTREIEADKKRVAAEKKKMSTAEAKISKTSSDFIETYETLVGQIQGDIEKIKSYLS